MLRLRSVVAASIAVFVAAASFIFSTSSDIPVATRRATPAERASIAASSPAFSFARTDASPPATANPDSEWSPDDPPLVVARRYREAKDKRAFFDHAMKVGGGANLFFALEARTRCAKVNQLGMVGAEQDMISRISVDDPARLKRIEAYRGFIRGCEGFEMKPVGRTELVEITRRLYEADDPTGRAANMRAFPDTADEYDAQAATARELLATRDPYILKLVAPYLAARRAGNLTWPQLVAGGAAVDSYNREANAWNLALCDLGLDCTPSGPMGPMSCFSVGKCDWTTLDEIAPVLLVNGGIAPLSGRRDEIVAAVRAGDWAKLGL